MTQPAFCPNCGSPGVVGQPCARAHCQTSGYRFIPAEYFARRVGKDGLVDRMLGLRFGEWLVVGTLGAGGIGSVYLALQGSTDIKGALKVLTTTRGELVARFADEAKALVQLTSPHVVRVYTFDLKASRPYLVMEYIEGGRTLQDALRVGLSVGDALDVLRGVVKGLSAAHARGIVHRDIKPANIMLQRLDSGEDFVRLVDFGLAKSLEAGDETSVIAGTPIYMAPEQFRLAEIGPWTDWYAVGVLAFVILTGQRPFRGLTDSEIYDAKRSGTYDPTLQLEQRPRPKVAAFLRYAMATEPRDRIRDGVTFKRELEAAFQAAGEGAAIGQKDSLSSTRMVTLVSGEVLTDDSPSSLASEEMELLSSEALAAALVVDRRTRKMVDGDVLGAPVPPVSEAANLQVVAEQNSRPAPGPLLSRAALGALVGGLVVVGLVVWGVKSLEGEEGADAGRVNTPGYDGGSRFSPPTAAPPTAAPPTAPPTLPPEVPATEAPATETSQDAGARRPRRWVRAERPVEDEEAPPTAAPETIAMPGPEVAWGKELMNARRRCDCDGYEAALDRIAKLPGGDQFLRKPEWDRDRCEPIVTPEAQRCENGKAVDR